MACDILETTERKPLSAFEPVSWLVSAARALMRSRHSRLDVDALSDYMKRDLGFMDWGEPRHEDEMFQ